MNLLTTLVVAIVPMTAFFVAILVWSRTRHCPMCGTEIRGQALTCSARCRQQKSRSHRQNRGVTGQFERVTTGRGGECPTVTVDGKVVAE